MDEDWTTPAPKVEKVGAELTVSEPPIPTLPVRLDSPETLMPLLKTPISVTVSDDPTPTLPETTKDPPTPKLPKFPVPKTWKLYPGLVVPTPTLPLLVTNSPFEALGPAWKRVNGLELPTPTLPVVETNSWLACWVSLVPS